MVKNAITVELQDTLQRSTKTHSPKHQNLRKQMSIRSIQTPKKSDDEESVNYLTSYQQLYDQVYDSNYDSDSDDYVTAISSDSANHLEHLKAKTKFGNILANSMIDSGSVCSLITKTLANRILKTTPLARWITMKQDNDLKTFSSEPIKFLGKLATTVTYNVWTC